MTGATGLEPATSAVTGQRSNQLSYAPRLRGEMAPALRARVPVCQGFAIAYATFSGLPARRPAVSCFPERCAPAGSVRALTACPPDDNWPADQSRGRLPADGARGTSSAAQRQPAGGDRR